MPKVIILSGPSGCGKSTWAKEDIVVDNTNLDTWEWQNYHNIARAFPYRVEHHTWVVMTVREMHLCAARNKHGVPLAVIAQMAMWHNYCPATFHEIEPKQS